MIGILSILIVVIPMLILTSSTFGIAPLVYCLFVFRGAKGRMLKTEKKIDTTLMQDEKIVVKGVQHRAYALIKRRTVIILTNNRVIVMYRGILGGFKIKSIQWKNIIDAGMSENIFPNKMGTDLWFSYFLVPDDPNASKDKIRIFGMPNEVASGAYAHAQAEQQAWQEKRRIRTMEQNRAAAGGTYISSGPSSGHVGNISGVVSELSSAKKMLDDGVISNSEFQEIKSKLLNKSL